MPLCACFSSIIPVVAATLFLASCAKDAKDPDPGARGPYPRLRGASSAPIAVRADDKGRVRTLEGCFTTTGTTAEERARSFIQTFKEDLGLTDAAAQLTVDRVLPADKVGGQAVVFGQQVSGLPVFGATLTVHLDQNGAVIFVSVDLVPETSLATTTPTLSKADAKNASEASLARFPGYAPYPPTSSAPELMVLCPGLFAEDPGAIHLVWSVHIDGGTINTQRQVFLDAATGEIRFTVPLSHEALDRETYLVSSIEPPTSDARAVVAGGPTLVVWDEGGQVKEAGQATDSARQLHTFGGQVHAYFKDRLGWDSYNGAGAKLQLYVEYPPAPEEAHADEVQAFYRPGPSPVDDSFWFTAGAVQLDVLAHEFTHAVIHRTSGLVYAAYSGALHEALADIFAAFVDEQDRWRILDRDLKSPGSAEYTYGENDELSRPYPAHWSERHTLDSQACPCPAGDALLCLGTRCWDISWDRGATHENCTIISHALYLAYERMKVIHQQGGGSGEGGEIEVLEEVFWRTMTRYVRPATTFLMFRDQVRRACRDLVGTLSFTGYRDCGAIINAFADVGLGTGDRDNDSLDDEWDNCPDEYNPQQEDQDADGVGDACLASPNMPDAGSSTPPPSSLSCPKAFTTHTCTKALYCPDSQLCEPVDPEDWFLVKPPNPIWEDSHLKPMFMTPGNYYQLNCLYEHSTETCGHIGYGFSPKWIPKGVAPGSVSSEASNACLAPGMVVAGTRLNSATKQATIHFPTIQEGIMERWREEVLSHAKPLLAEIEKEAADCP